MRFKLGPLAGFGFPRRPNMVAQSYVVPKTLSADIPIDEEMIPGYDPKSFFHPDPGDVLNNRYNLKAKIGWGTSSTVWLAQDIRE
jgi:serine/threonine-protein kinase SRPK3